MLSLLLLLASSASALTADHEKFEYLGWNKQCSVAFAQYVYPKLGEAMVDDPIETRIGTLTIPPAGQLPVPAPTLSLTGPRSWEPAQAVKAKAKLKKDGWSLQGFTETLRPEPVVELRDLPRLLLSTDTFRTRAQGFPQKPWRLSTIYYAPFASECALLLYTQGEGKKMFYKPMLIRVGNPIIRDDRALAHITNGLLLLERGDAPGALAEERIAAVMDPEYGPARYHHAALLTLNGKFEPAIDELAEAVRIEPLNGPKAKKDRDFDGLRWHPRFKELAK
jgi:hypothetical protein